MTIRSSRFATALTLVSTLALAGQLSTPGAYSTEPNAQDELTELDYPIDNSIQLFVDPVLPSSLVDRVGAPATIAVKGSGLLTADLYSVPVDSPYGGLVIAKPHYMGRAQRRQNGLFLKWDTIEPCKYVKVFAVVRKRGAPAYVRSRTIDLCMIGPRLKADSP